MGVKHKILLYWGFLGVLVVAFLGMLVCCYVAFDKTVLAMEAPVYKVEHIYRHYPSFEFVSRETGNGQFAPAVDRIERNLQARIDSLAKEGFNMQRQFDNSLSDLRQESNNNINKVNGWLGFWIALAAILGVGIPICSQIIISKEMRDEIAECKKELGRKDLKIQKLIAQMRFGIDNKLITADSSNRFAQHTWTEILDDIEELSSDIFDKKLTTKDRYMVQGLLIQLSELITEMMQRIYTDRSRDFQQSIDKVRNLFVKLDNGEPDEESLRKDFKHLINRLRTLV